MNDKKAHRETERQSDRVTTEQQNDKKSSRKTENERERGKQGERQK